MIKGHIEEEEEAAAREDDAKKGYKPHSVSVQKWSAPSGRAASAAPGSRVVSTEMDGVQGLVAKLMQCSKDPIDMCSLDFYNFGR